MQKLIHKTGDKNVDNVDNKKSRTYLVQHAVYHKVGGAGRRKTFYLGEARRRRFTAGPLFRVWRILFMAGIFRVRQVRVISAGRVASVNVKK